jgi:hypothetical protein
MDWVHIALATFGLIASGAGTVLWYLFLSTRADVKENSDRVDKLQAELAEYKLYAATHYVTHGALTQAIDSLNIAIRALTDGIRDMNRDFSQKLDSLHRRLDGKADKP